MMAVSGGTYRRSLHRSDGVEIVETERGMEEENHGEEDEKVGVSQFKQNTHEVYLHINDSKNSCDALVVLCGSARL